MGKKYGKNHLENPCGLVVYPMFWEKHGKTWQCNKTWGTYRDLQYQMGRVFRGFDHCSIAGMRCWCVRLLFIQESDMFVHFMFELYLKRVFQWLQGTASDAFLTHLRFSVLLQSALGRDDLLQAPNLSRLIKLKKSPSLLQLEQNSHAADQRCILISDGPW